MNLLPPTCRFKQSTGGYFRSESMATKSFIPKPTNRFFSEEPRIQNRSHVATVRGLCCKGDLQ
jgi:hypothetical protein